MPCNSNCINKADRCKDKPPKGLSFRLNKDDNLHTVVIEARTLKINHLYEWELEEGSAYETTLFSSIKLQYDQILSPPALQQAHPLEPMIISFHSYDFYKLSSSNVILPEYLSGLYILTNVLIEEIALDQDCCCNKIKVIKARGTFECVSNIPTVPDRNCQVDIYPIAQPITIKECKPCS